MVWYGIWFGMVYGLVYGIWFGIWYGMVWYGMVWYGMVWYGMVWYGMVWYGKKLLAVRELGRLRISVVSPGYLLLPSTDYRNARISPKIAMFSP